MLEIDLAVVDRELMDLHNFIDKGTDRLRSHLTAHILTYAFRSITKTFQT